jgi:hypothetical protein
MMTDVLTELDPENSVFITRDELRALREKAAKVDKLEDEVSSLVRQKRAQDARLGEVDALNEKNAEINRLTEDNAQLTEELEAHKNRSLKVDGLEKENKRLAEELKHAFGRARDDGTTGTINGPKSTPTLSEPPSSAVMFDSDGSRVVSKEIYESLVRKFNKLYENNSNITSARDRLEEALTAERNKMRRSQEYFDYLEKKVKKRDARIERQDEELRRLRAEIREVDDESQILHGQDITPKMSSTQEREAQTLEKVSAALNSASMGPIRYGGRAMSFEDILQALNSPTLNEIVETARRSRAPTSSPIKRCDPVGSKPLGSGEVRELFPASREADKIQDGRSTPYELPMLLPGGDNRDGERVADTEFEVLEPHHTTTPYDHLQHTSPEKAAAQGIKEEPPTDAPPSPDTVVIISSKSVRKRKSRKDSVELHDTPRVKIETISSSPLGLAAFAALDASLDLDDIGEKQVTPRKGRPFLHQALSNTSTLAKIAWNQSQGQHYNHFNDLHDSQRLLQVPQETPIRRIGSALQPRSPNTIFPRTSAERAPKRRRIVADRALSDVMEDGQIIQSIEKSSRKAPTLEQAQLLVDLLAKASPPKHVLSPGRFTPNQPKLRRTVGGAAVSSRAYETPRDDIPTTANFGPPLSTRPTKSKESAEPPIPTSRGNVRKSVETSMPASLRNSADPLRPASRGTFKDSALGSSRPTSRDSPEGDLRTSKPLKASSRNPTEFPRPPPRDSVLASDDPKRQQPQPHRSALKTHQTGQSRLRDQNTTPTRTRIPSLRTRPLNELTLQDFKVNPKYNQGFNYAFSDVVRNQAERRCLQGCTKPDCCGGKFRALAKATRDWSQPLTMSQEEADNKTLKEFLGDNSYKIRNMTKAERQEILLQALTREMSNKFGKHRHAYERKSSPPGYWRSDFADTQEQAEDRAKAEQIQRSQVAHRYEEAMRPGGAFMFRDE